VLNAWSERQRAYSKPSHPDPLAAASDRRPAHAFRAEEKDPYGSPGAMVLLKVDSNGRAKRTRLDQNYIHSVESW